MVLSPSETLASFPLFQMTKLLAFVYSGINSILHISNSDQIAHFEMDLTQFVLNRLQQLLCLWFIYVSRYYLKKLVFQNNIVYTMHLSCCPQDVCMMPLFDEMVSQIKCKKTGFIIWFMFFICMTFHITTRIQCRFFYYTYLQPIQNHFVWAIIFRLTY